MGHSIASPLDDAFGQLVNKKLEEWHVSGVSIAVIRNDQVFARGFGLASVPSKPVTPSTLFYTGSTTKAFTAAAWAQLIGSEENQKKTGSDKISFSTPLSSLIRDDFVLSDEYATTHITIEDALSHRTGMSRHDNTYGGPIDTPKKIVRSLRYLPLASEPRTKFEYCNLMYVAASHALETVTGKWLGTTLKEDIWEPLGMKNTFFDLHDALGNKETDTAKGYKWVEGTDGKDGEYVEEAYMDFPEVNGAGCVISNVLDYAKWVQMLINRGPPLTEEMHKQILEPRTIDQFAEPYDGIMTYALGWFVLTYKGERMIWHNGGLIGFGANLVYLPDHKWGCIMMGNTSITSNYMEHSLTMMLVDDLLNVPEEKRFDMEAKYRKVLEDEKAKAKTARKDIYPFIPDPPLALAIPIDSYAGTYTHPAYRSITFSVKDHCESTSDKSSHILFASCQDRTWPFVIEMEHVSGEYWIAYVSRGKGNEDREKSMSNVMSACKAQTEVSEDGKAKRLGIALEDGMEGVLIWFERNEA